MAPSSGRPNVIAHRGYQRAYPENTMAALGAAIECGARFLEIDVHLTADGVPVLLHDETLDRICGVAGVVHRHTIADMEKLSAHEPRRFGDRFAGERVARLSGCRELLTAHPQVRLFVELKESAARAFGDATVVERVVKTLRPVLDRCVVISFSIEMLQEARRQAGCAVGPVVRKWKDRSVVDRFERWPEFLFCDIRGLPQRGDLHIENVDLAVYEVPDAPTAMTLYERGVGYVETYGVCEMLAALGGAGPIT